MQSNHYIMIDQILKSHEIHFKFDTGGTHALPKSRVLIQFTRYVHGNLITSNLDDILKIEPYPKRNGGKIHYKNGSTDFFYKIWPLYIHHT